VRAEEIELEKRGEISVAKHKKQTDLMKRVENIKRIRKAAGTY
jgi:flagellar basal body rod protein FlgF